MNAHEVKEAAKRCGADLCGIASAERFAKLPPEANPLSIKPDTHSVVVLGFRVTRGSLCGMEEGTAWHVVQAGNPASHSMITREITYHVGRELESAGWEAAPVFGFPDELRFQGVPVREGKPAPEIVISMVYAAHAAGLGHMGLGKFFLTPEFGPRQVFTAILTDAKLEPDPVFADKVCDECGACVQECPAGALSANEFDSVQFTDCQMRWHRLKVPLCRVCETGVLKNPYHPNAEPWRVSAACGRACVAHLEDTGQLTRKFHNPFRATNKEC